MFKELFQNKILKYFTAMLFVGVAAFLSGYFTAVKLHQIPEENILVSRKKSEKPLEKYSIDNLSNTKIQAGSFAETTKLSDDVNFSSYLFRLYFNPETTGINYKTTSGVINYPSGKDSKKSPIVILIRGYVDQKTYKSGTGSKNIGQYLAKNGFITLAPDFLGYGNSDSEAGNIFESRFQTYTTIVTLIKSVESGILDKFWDGKNLFIWGHSNGGQIALTTLEITGGNYPTVLWAPVSKPFPYSVLYYTDESEDQGQLIRSELSMFEKQYDASKYSLTNYFDKINAPIQIHQGANDDAVPVSWSNTLSTHLKSLNKNVEYIKHAGADHNLNPAWNEAADESLEFFKKYTR